ncbi:MAG: hypothetical protein CMB82_09305 [Flammeovirgaceae bacterium]|nr:hypothetical protein [Flammeovirgaceae bacterium]
MLMEKSISKQNCFVILFNLVFCVSCLLEKPEEIREAEKLLPDIIDYNFHVKPILSDKCFACHGPDAKNQKANLRLDQKEHAYATLPSGNGKAVVPNSAYKSLIINRILSIDKSFIMPPPKTNLVLDSKEKAILIKWIEQGAEYKSHWAFIKPKTRKIPVNGEDWAINEIDHFILDKLYLNNIAPSPKARKEKLIRRLFFDLTGLPPSLRDLDYWLANTDLNYYENLVDTLINMPAFGERFAAHWLDVARFADSEGYLDDYHHTFWPYRDWVINAFNKNLPYDKFILWQVGGDQIPNATQEQKLATAFNRNHKQNSEGGIIPEEFRVEYVADRTNTLGSAFMGLTVGCARCHDHKYDPISQKDYYQLFSFFNSNIERGDAIFSLNAIENGQNVPNKYSMNAGPVLPLIDSETKAIREFLIGKIKQKEESIIELNRNNDKTFKIWLEKNSNFKTLQKSIKDATVNHITFDYMSNGKAQDLAEGVEEPHYTDEIISVKGILGKAVRSDASGKFIADGKRAVFERSDPFTIGFWINTPKVFENAHVIYNGNNRIQGYRGWDIVIKEGHLHFRLSHAHPYQSLDIKTTSPLRTDQWIHFVWTYNGSSRAEGMKLFINGEEASFIIERNFLYRSSKPFLTWEPTVYMGYQGLIIGNRHFDKGFTGGLIDELYVLNKEVDQFGAKFLYNSEQSIKDFEKAIDQKDSSIKEFYNLFIDPHIESNREDLKELRNKEVMLIDTVQEIMVMEDYEKKRSTYILDRGIYDARGEFVNSGVPESIFKMPDDLPRNRFGLGKWLTHPDNPLTARVAVNQAWYLIFGRGIVETAEDFGNQGSLPSHPELLDWLALDFQKNNWNYKRLIRQMVVSATYKQSSVIRPEISEIDPDNRLLARAPRYRRSAEMIRDNILASSGLLVSKTGGRSTFPYQPKGLWKEADVHSFFPGYKEDYSNGLYRRSLYTFWKRNMPPPNMLIFDASSRAECQIRRQRSNTPLQALVLLNDPQILEGCRVLAENAWINSKGNHGHAINFLFRSLTSRYPNEKELQILNTQYFQELKYFTSNPKNASDFLSIGHKKSNNMLFQANLAAMSRIANTIFNTTESYYKN